MALHNPVPIVSLTSKVNAVFHLPQGFCICCFLTGNALPPAITHFLYLFTQEWLRPSQATFPKSSAPFPTLNTTKPARFYFGTQCLIACLPTSVWALCGQGISMQHPKHRKHCQSCSSLSINALNVWKAYEKYKLQADFSYWRANNLEPVTK